MALDDEQGEMIHKMQNAMNTETKKKNDFGL